MQLFATQTHLAALLHFIVSEYFATFSSVLIVYSSSYCGSTLQAAYLHGIQHAFQNLSAQRTLIGLQWIDVDRLQAHEFEQKMLSAVNNTVIEGFISILPNTTHFLHTRYYATRHANLRLKDKLYLFLCEHENPMDLLGTEILQFYPHHLMIRPSLLSVNRTTYNKTESPKPDTTWQRASMASSSARPKGISVAAAAMPMLSYDYRDINFEMWTQKFVGAVGNLDAVRLNAFLPNETFTENAKLYPNKLQNFEGRTLRLGTITYAPYTIANYVPAGTGNTDPINPNSPNRSISYFGSESNIIRTFCHLYNCHMRVEAYGDDNWGSIYENETADGMLGAVYTQRVEIAIGCIYNWYAAITETSYPIARSAVTILGPAPALFPAWRTSSLPFDGTTWLILIVIVFICAFILYLLIFSSYYLHGAMPSSRFQHCEILVKSTLNIFALFIQQPSAPTTFDRFAARFFLATLLCATITLENIYSGQLKSLLTVPFYAEPVDTIEKFAQSNWKWAAPSIIWITTVENSELAKEQSLVRNFELCDYDFLYNASFRTDYGLGIERINCGRFSIGKYITMPALEQSIVLKDDLYFDWTRAVSIRGWVLLPLLNRHILTCTESGLYNYWELEIVHKFGDLKMQEALLDMQSGYTSKIPPTPFGIKHISGPLVILIFGYTLASLVLLCEVLFWQCYGQHSKSAPHI